MFLDGNIVEYEPLIKLLVAFIFGALIGLERSLKRKSASLKTSIVLCITSCVVTIVSIYSADIYAEMSENTMMDPLRLAAQLISGIGFIGAGVILVRNNDVVSGITTAAIMWASVGFGIAIGAGFFIEAAVALMLLMAGVELLPLLLKWIGPNSLREKEYKLKIWTTEQTAVPVILKELEQIKIKPKKIRIRDLKEKEQFQIDLIIYVEEKRAVTVLFDEIKNIPHIGSIDLESLDL